VWPTRIKADERERGSSNTVRVRKKRAQHTTYSLIRGHIITEYHIISRGNIEKIIERKLKN